MKRSARGVKTINLSDEEALIFAVFPEKEKEVDICGKTENVSAWKVKKR